MSLRTMRKIKIYRCPGCGTAIPAENKICHRCYDRAGYTLEVGDRAILDDEFEWPPVVREVVELQDDGFVCKMHDDNVFPVAHLIKVR